MIPVAGVDGAFSAETKAGPPEGHLVDRQHRNRNTSASTLLTRLEGDGLLYIVDVGGGGGGGSGNEQRIGTER